MVTRVTGDIKAVLILKVPSTVSVAQNAYYKLDDVLNVFLTRHYD